MPKSAAFIQIKAGVLEIVAQIPQGRVTTYGAIGEHLNVMARHVAYILTTLPFEEQQDLPWHRVVAEGGAIASGRLNAKHTTQIERLKKEGIKFTSKNYVEAFDVVYCDPAQLVPWERSTARYRAE